MGLHDLEYRLSAAVVARMTLSVGGETGDAGRFAPTGQVLRFKGITVASSEVPYEIESCDDYSVIALFPQLNETPWTDIEMVGSEILDSLHSTNPPVFVVDLSALHYAGSALVALVLRVWKRASERDGHMVIVNKNPAVFEVLRLAGLTNIWTVASSRDEAVRVLRSNAFRVQRRQTALTNVLGVIAVIGAGAGLLHAFFPTPYVPEQAAMAMQFGCSAIAAIAGLTSIVKYRGFSRFLGVMVLLAGLGVAATGAWRQLY
jgi:anti-anti-sigma factor